MFVEAIAVDIVLLVYQKKLFFFVERDHIGDSPRLIHKK